MWALKTTSVVYSCRLHRRTAAWRVEGGWREGRRVGEGRRVEDW